jgi:hypothetical protein
LANGRLEVLVRVTYGSHAPLANRHGLERVLPSTCVK